MKTILKILVIVILVFTNSYAQLTHTFTQTDRNTHSGQARGVAVGPNGTIFLEPSTEVPYVVVRDNVCLVYGQTETAANDLIINARLECAQIALDQSTLNQLLRTQTV